MATLISFDDLAHGTKLSGSNYAGLIWEAGNAGYNGNEGYWAIPSESSSSYPSSGSFNVINSWGSTLIGIGFPSKVNVSGAYFSAQGSASSWTSGVRAHGYREGIEVMTTGWFLDIDTNPDWFAMNLMNVDRIIIESVATSNGGGWYGMDDLTYSVIPEPMSASLILLIFPLMVIRRNFSTGEKRCSGDLYVYLNKLFCFLYKDQAGRAFAENRLK